MKILSIDASSKSTGYAIYENGELKDYGCLTASSTDVIKRIQKIQKELENIMKENSDIQEIILEEVRPITNVGKGNFGAGGTNIQTHRVLMWTQAAIAFSAHEYLPKAKLSYIYPSEWRAACGIKSGRGIKRESQKPYDIAFVKEKFNIVANDDICDAIGIGYGYLQKEDETKMKVDSWGH